MGSEAIITLSPGESAHVKIMQAIAQDMRDLPMVLKGGTSLLLCYGLDRFSEDLDFDAPKKFSIAGRVEKILSRHVSSFDIKTVKDTETVQRLKIHYQSEAISRLLKIETSFRQAPNPADVVEVNGIKTYRVGMLIEQKINALLNRTKARDLYDVAFLAREFRHEFSDSAAVALSEAVSKIDELESRFSLAFEDDTILDIEQLPDLLLQLTDSFS